KDCVVCIASVPACPTCEEGQECKIIPTTCDKCSYAVCESKPSMSTSLTNCVACLRVATEKDCHCAADEECKVTPATCTECSNAACVKKNEGKDSGKENKGNGNGKKSNGKDKTCVACTKNIPVCKDGCKEGKECKVFKGSCTKCPYAKCVPIKECVACPAVVPACKSQCGKDEYCKITPTSCHSCAKATCAKINKY
ncbi:hypothetical protein ROZALSC1DRAFT_31160, partial [Rozella allomycis CSF55]